VDEKTVRNVFRDYAAHLEATHPFVTPAWLGIDELTLLRKPRCILTNLREATVVSLLTTRTHSVVRQHLAQLPKRETVEIVSMDMWHPYREATRAALPQARIIIDKFHVVRMANQAVETVRKTLRAGLTEKQRRALMHDRFALLKRADDLNDRGRLTLDLWTKHMPLLASAYAAKEAFCRVWDASGRVDAEARYTEWLQQLAPNLEAAFAPFVTALGNWHDEIFAYFVVPGTAVTNATTEALNGLAKLAQRMGRGWLGT
jgi:transposase